MIPKSEQKTVNTVNYNWWTGSVTKRTKELLSESQPHALRTRTNIVEPQPARKKPNSQWTPKRKATNNCNRIHNITCNKMQTTCNIPLRSMQQLIQRTGKYGRQKRQQESKNRKTAQGNEKAVRDLEQKIANTNPTISTNIKAKHTF